jgi:group I intron endonuclease
MAELYRLTSPSNKQYIGIAKNGLQNRFTVHVSEAKSGSMTALHKAIRKYGSDAFVKEILVVSDYEYIRDLEIKAIEAFNTKSPNGYNLTIGGDGTNGYSHTDCTKQKISALAKIRMAEPERRKYLSELNTGKKQSAETKEKIRLTSLGRRHMLGKKHSDEAKQKISQALIGNTHTKGMPFSDEHRAKLSAAGKVRVFTEQHRENLRKAQLGRKYSDEVRMNMSNASKIRHQNKMEDKNANF